MSEGNRNSRRLDIVYPAIAAQWNYEKNNGLKPSDVSYGSSKRVWWRCEKGHEWESTVYNRASGRDCPYCSGKGKTTDQNSLASCYPEIAAQWLQEKNGVMTPDEVKISSRIQVWWRCEKGHEWKSSVEFRTRKRSGCPYCAGKRVMKGFNDLATANPELAKEWNTEKNNGLTAEEVHPGSNKIYWWKCALGHEWKARVCSRTGYATGCPYCTNRKVLKGFNDLATVEPRIAAQWHPTLNGTLTPDMVLSGTHRYAWWQCSEGHVWKARIDSRVAYKYFCPVCTGKRKVNDRYRFVDEKVIPLPAKPLDDAELELVAGGAEGYDSNKQRHPG